MYLKDIKNKKWKIIPKSKMTTEQLEFYNNYLDKKNVKTESLKYIHKENMYFKEKSIIISPIYLPVKMKLVADKVISINMNNYRNWNFILSNKYKILYKDIMKEQLQWLRFNRKIKIEYTLFWKKKPDWMNIISVISKFFLDAMVDYWCITDDNVNIVIGESWKDWWLDKDNPRVEIKII